MKVCAGIVLYDPDVERLKLCVEAVRGQVDQLVFVDNASADIDELQRLFPDENYVWIKNEENLGIAKALNQLIDFAEKNNYPWMLTLDQDSICEDGMVQKMVAVAENESNADEKSDTSLNTVERQKSDVIRIPGEGSNKDIAMVSPLIIDRGLSEVGKPSDKPPPEVEEIRFCITSGCLTNVKAILDTGGFNEWLFIYDVDREICIRLFRRGYRLVRVNNTRLYHEHGLKTVYRRFLWKKVVYRNYTPFSVYYMTRNLVYMLRKYGKEYSPQPFLRWVRLYFAFCVKFIFEPDRMLRLKAFKRGIRDGYAANENHPVL